VGECAGFVLSGIGCVLCFLEVKVQGGIVVFVWFRRLE